MPSDGPPKVDSVDGVRLKPITLRPPMPRGVIATLDSVDDVRLNGIIPMIRLIFQPDSLAASAETARVNVTASS